MLAVFTLGSFTGNTGNTRRKLASAPLNTHLIVFPTAPRAKNTTPTPNDEIIPAATNGAIAIAPNPGEGSRGERAAETTTATKRQVAQIIARNASTIKTTRNDGQETPNR